MSAIRLILLLIVLGCLTLLLLQNWSPVLPLVFLGLQTQPLPLAVWVVFSLVTGAMSAMAIALCFSISNLFTQPRPRKRRQVVQAPPPRSNPPPRAATPSSDYSTSYTAATPQVPKATPNPSPDLNEWESESSDDWDFEEDIQPPQPQTQPPTQNQVRDKTDYEVKNEPKSSNRSGSVYSYNYREPSDSGVGKTESVYDADYRVLTPPYRQTTTSDTADDDWGFEDDEFDFDDEGKSDSPRQGK